MHHLPRVVLLCLLLHPAASRTGELPGFYPDTGHVALHQRAVDLTSSLRVLMIALRPGHEDLSALAYFRLNRGARVMTIYFTNGESGESDVQWETPDRVAATLRAEASGAMGRIEGESLFLNLPDPGSAADTTAVFRLWNRDSAQTRLARVVAQFAPQMILLSRDRDNPGKSPLWAAGQATILSVIRQAQLRKKPVAGVSPVQGDGWQVERFWADAGQRGGTTVPVDRRHPLHGISYSTIGRALAEEYASLSAQRRWRNDSTSYMLVFPGSKTAFKSVDEGLPKPPGANLAPLARKLNAVAAALREGKDSRPVLLKRIVRVLDSVDATIVQAYERGGATFRQLVSWKGSLESLRLALLGVTVSYALSESVLTARQLTYLKITSVSGLTPGGTTELYVPSAERGWVLNESVKSRIPLQIPGEYRLLSPEHVDLDLPTAENGITQPTTTRPLTVYLLHRGRTREENFVYPIMLPFHYAPRFTVEVLTPLVRAVPGEQVIARLTNNSRDGVKDTVRVEDSLAFSNALPFRLSGKGLTQTGSLTLSWRKPLTDGTYILPLSIGGETVGKFAARAFDAAIDSTRRVGVLSGFENSPTLTTLRRLGISPVRLNRAGLENHHSTENIDVIVVDRRYTTLVPSDPSLAATLRRFAESGGHVVVLAQDAKAWNTMPLWDRVHLTDSPLLDEFTRVAIDSLHPLIQGPNQLNAGVFEDWVFRVGHNDVQTSGSIDVPFRVAASGRPLLVTAGAGRGRFTYVDLALQPQWMSIHPGAFKILANILALKSVVE